MTDTDTSYATGDRQPSVIRAVSHIGGMLTGNESRPSSKNWRECGKITAINQEWPGAVAAARTVASERVRSRMHRKSIPELTPEQIEKFWSFVDVPDQPSCCWEWRGPQWGGYGLFHFARKSIRAHRMAYRILCQEDPADLDVHHLCQNKLCVNPDHLQPITNSHHGEIGTHNNKAYCIRGHAFTPENTYVNNAGARLCRECIRINARIQSKRKRERIRANRKPVILECVWCGKSYTRVRGNQRHCSLKCRRQYQGMLQRERRKAAA